MCQANRSVLVSWCQPDGSPMHATRGAVLMLLESTCGQGKRCTIMHKQVANSYGIAGSLPTSLQKTVTYKVTRSGCRCLPLASM